MFVHVGHLDARSLGIFTRSAKFAKKEPPLASNRAWRLVIVPAIDQIQGGDRASAPVRRSPWLWPSSIKRIAPARWWSCQDGPWPTNFLSQHRRCDTPLAGPVRARFSSNTNPRPIRVDTIQVCVSALIGLSTSLVSRFTASMMLVPADAFDIVPRRGLVALFALIDPRVRPTGYARRNHLEVHHVVTRRSLVALAAIIRFWRRMFVFGNRPVVGRVTLCTIAAKNILVAIVVRVAGSAIEDRFLQTDAVVWRNRMSQFLLKRRERESFFGPTVGAAENLHSDGRQQRVVHLRQTCTAPPMLQVTLLASADAGVKGGRLTLQYRLVVRMTGNALRRFDSKHGGVAGGAIILERLVGG